MRCKSIVVRWPYAIKLAARRRAKFPRQSEAYAAARRALSANEIDLPR
jgi:hypothetical protein